MTDSYHLKMGRIQADSADFGALVDYVKQLKEPIQPVIDGRIQRNKLSISLICDPDFYCKGYALTCNPQY